MWSILHSIKFLKYINDEKIERDGKDTDRPLVLGTLKVTDFIDTILASLTHTWLHMT